MTGKQAGSPRQLLPWIYTAASLYAGFWVLFFTVDLPRYGWQHPYPGWLDIANGVLLASAAGVSIGGLVIAIRGLARG